MDAHELNERLAIAEGTLTISDGTLTPAVGSFLADIYNGAPIVISGAQKDTTTDPGAVLVSGRSSFLRTADIPVSARFSVDAAGEVRAVIRYQLRPAELSAGGWVFSHSFPGLPPVINYDMPLPAGAALASFDIYAGQRPLLDGLTLFDTWLVVSTHAGQDAESGVPIEAGINFVSKMMPQGVVGVLEGILHEGGHLTLHGPIRVPKPTDRTVPLQPLELAWDRPDAPGIHLRADLGVSAKLGKLVFDQALFRIYSPISGDWLSDNDSFRPAHGYAGRLAIPSAGVEVDLGADLQWSVPDAFLYGLFEGVSLGKLAHLLDLTGEGGLSSHLPAALQAPIDALDKLSLERLALSVGAGGGAPEVSYVAVTVGVPDLDWHVWGDHLVVEDLSCIFEIQTSSSAGAGGQATSPVTVTLCGTLDIEGFPLTLYATKDGGDFIARAVSDRGIGLPLDKLLKAHGPGVPLPTPLNVDKLGVTVAPGLGYGMFAELASDPHPWVIPVGKGGGITVSDVVLNFQVPAEGSSTGSFAGTIDFLDDLTLSASYDFPGALTVRSVVPKLRLTRAVERLCDHLIPLPRGFDLEMENVTVVMVERSSGFVFQVCAEVDGFGLVGFEVQKVGAGGWGFAAGVDLGASSPSRVPGMSLLGAIDKALSIQKLMLVVSSIENVDFQFPDAAQLNAPLLPAGNVRLPSQAGGIQRGVNFYGEWELDEKDRTQRAIKKLVGLRGTLGVTLAVDPAEWDVKFFVHENGKLLGHPFSFQCGFMAKLVEGVVPIPSWYLSGSVTVPVQGHPVDFDVTTVFSPIGVYVSGDMKTPAPIDFKLFKVADLAFQACLGADGLPSVGFAGTIDVKAFESSIAVFPNAADPLNSLVAGSVSDLTLKDVAEVFTGGHVPRVLAGVLDKVGVKGTHQFSIPGALAADLGHLSMEGVAAAFKSAGDVVIPSDVSQLLVVADKAGEGGVWHLTDLTTMRHYALVRRGGSIEVSIEPQFYFSPMPMYVGTTAFPAGFYVNGAISFFGFHAEVTVDISPSEGIRVDAEMSKIKLISDHVFSIQAAKGGGGPRLSVSTFEQPKDPVPELRPPHFLINGQAWVLGFGASVYASAGPEGLLFDLRGQPAPELSIDLHARFQSHVFEAGGAVRAGVGTIDLGRIGKIKVNTFVEGSIDVSIDGERVDVKVDAVFSFLKERAKIEARLGFKDKVFADLPAELAREVEGHLRALFKDVDRWADAFKHGLVEGVERPAKVLEEVYGKSAREAEKLGADLERGAAEAAKAAARAAEDVGKGVGKAGKEVGRDVGRAAKGIGDDVKKLFH